MQLISLRKFCMLKLYWIHSLSLIGISVFLGESLGFSIYKIISSTNRVLLFPFQFRCLLLIFFACLFWSGLLVLCWIEVMRVGTCLLSTWWKRKNFPSFTAEYSVNWGLVIYGLLLCCGMFSFCPLCWVFIRNGYWILSNAFPSSIDKILWFLSSILLMWCISLTDLWILNYLCIPEINLTWSF